MTTSLRSKAEFLRKLQDFDLLPHKDLLVEAPPQGLGIYSMQRLAQACGANPDPMSARKKCPSSSKTF